MTQAREIAVEVTFLRGTCAAGRVVLHRGLSIEQRRTSTRAMATAAESIWFAFYPQAMLENGREPFDQPMPAAYLPLAYADMRLIMLRGYGALLVQRERIDRIRDVSLMGDELVSCIRFVASEEDLAKVMREIADLAGVPDSVSSALYAPQLTAPAA